MMHRNIIIILCALFLAACQPAKPATSDFSAIYTSSAATAFFMGTEIASIAMLTPDPSIPPTVTSEPTAANTLIVRETPTPWPTQMPTITPTKVSGVLQQTLRVQPLASFNGHTIEKVTGWSSSFKDFRWMGTNHLLLDAIIEKEPHPEHNDGIVTHPVVANLASGKIWIPELAEDVLRDRSFGYYDLPHWSEKLQRIILEKGNRQDSAVEVYTLDGEIEQSYPGTLLGVSPSGTKLLFSDGTWLDLLSGKTVKFAWEQNYNYYKPTWSADETRVAVCCFAYGDAKTGESSEQISLPEYDPNIFSPGKWTFDNKHILGIKNSSRELYGSPPLLNLSTKSLQTIGELAGIPTRFDDGSANMCNFWFAAPNGKYVWISCFDGSHLVDLAAFKAWDYPLSSMPLDVNWTEDSNFAKVIINDGSPYSRILILPVASQKLMPVPDDCNLLWPPIGNMLVCQSKTESALSILNIQTMAVQKELKPGPDCKNLAHYNDGLFSCISKDLQALSLLDAKTLSIQHEIELVTGILSTHKSPDGDHLALLAQDGSLWLAGYPSLENLEQLTPATTSQIGQIAWSPDGRYLAFLGDTDIYIVDTRVTP